MLNSFSKLGNISYEKFYSPLLSTKNKLRNNCLADYTYPGGLDYSGGKIKFCSYCFCKQSDSILDGCGNHNFYSNNKTIKSKVCNSHTESDDCETKKKQIKCFELSFKQLKHPQPQVFSFNSSIINQFSSDVLNDHTESAKVSSMLEDDDKSLGSVMPCKCSISSKILRSSKFQFRKPVTSQLFKDSYIFRDRTIKRGNAKELLKPEYHFYNTNINYTINFLGKRRKRNSMTHPNYITGKNRLSISKDLNRIVVSKLIMKGYSYSSDQYDSDSDVDYKRAENPEIRRNTKAKQPAKEKVCHQLYKILSDLISEIKVKFDYPRYMSMLSSIESVIEYSNEEVKNEDHSSYLLNDFEVDKSEVVRQLISSEFDYSQGGQLTSSFSIESRLKETLLNIITQPQEVNLSSFRTEIIAFNSILHDSPIIYLEGRPDFFDFGEEEQAKKRKPKKIKENKPPIQKQTKELVSTEDSKTKLISSLQKLDIVFKTFKEPWDSTKSSVATNQRDCEKRKKFSLKNRLKIREGTADKLIQCHICGIKFDTGFALGGHMSRKHKNKSEKYSKKVKVREMRKKDREILHEARKKLLQIHNLDYEDLLKTPIGRKKIKAYLRGNKKIYRQLINESKKKRGPRLSINIPEM